MIEMAQTREIEIGVGIDLDSAIAALGRHWNQLCNVTSFNARVSGARTIAKEKAAVAAT